MSLNYLLYKNNIRQTRLDSCLPTVRKRKLSKPEKAILFNTYSLKYIQEAISARDLLYSRPRLVGAVLYLLLNFLY